MLHVLIPPILYNACCPGSQTGTRVLHWLPSPSSCLSPRLINIWLYPLTLLLLLCFHGLLISSLLFFRGNGRMHHPDRGVRIYLSPKPEAVLMCLNLTRPRPAVMIRYKIHLLHRCLETTLRSRSAVAMSTLYNSWQQIWLEERRKRRVEATHSDVDENVMTHDSLLKDFSDSTSYYMRRVVYFQIPLCGVCTISLSLCGFLWVLRVLTTH